MSEITLENIAKHCIDQNITSPQIAYLLAVQAEIKRLRGIEVAVIDGQERHIAALNWQNLGKALGWHVALVIADALEV